MLCWRPGYALAAIAIFAIEVAIALFVHDSFVRPYLGDTLAVVLAYLALRAVIPLRVADAALVALVIAFAVEIGQALDILDVLGLRGNRLARIVLGSDFALLDLVAYGAGAVLILAIEAMRGDGGTAP